MSRFECFENCPLAERKIDSTLLKNGEKIHICNMQDKELYFSPVGNSSLAPSAIICGKTADYKTMTKFYELIKQGYSVGYAGFKTVFSNKILRRNLYNALSEIRFFELMKKVNSNWNSDDTKALWELMFENEDFSNNSGLLLTQSCNCAIVKEQTSKEPPKSVFSQIYAQNPECLFNGFQASDKLKLIIFLDSPSKDPRFHQIDFFRKTKYYKWCIENGVEIISIPHPSGSNRIYNDISALSQNIHIKSSKEIIEKIINSYEDNI